LSFDTAFLTREEEKEQHGTLVNGGAQAVKHSKAHLHNLKSQQLFQSRFTSLGDAAILTAWQTNLYAFVNLQALYFAMAPAAKVAALPALTAQWNLLNLETLRNTLRNVNNLVAQAAGDVGFAVVCTGAMPNVCVYRGWTYTLNNYGAVVSAVGLIGVGGGAAAASVVQDYCDYSAFQWNPPSPYQAGHIRANTFGGGKDIINFFPSSSSSK